MIWSEAEEIRVELEDVQRTIGFFLRMAKFSFFQNHESQCIQCNDYFSHVHEWLMGEEKRLKTLVKRNLV